MRNESKYRCGVATKLADESPYNRAETFERKLRMGWTVMHMGRRSRLGSGPGNTRFKPSREQMPEIQRAVRRSLHPSPTTTFQVTDAPRPSQFGHVVRSAPALPACEIPFSWLPALVYKTQQQWTERFQSLPSTPTIAPFSRSSMMSNCAGTGPCRYKPYADSIGSMPLPKHALDYGAYGVQDVPQASDYIALLRQSSKWQLEQELCDS